MLFKAISSFSDPSILEFYRCRAWYPCRRRQNRGNIIWKWCYTSNSLAFLQAAAPQAVAVSCGLNNDYGHPHRAALQNFAAVGAEKMKTNEETSLALLQEVKPLLAAQEDFSNDALFEMLSAFGKEKGYKTGYIMWPIRTALSGKQMTPAGATEILEVLGKEESLARIDKAIEKLSK